MSEQLNIRGEIDQPRTWDNEPLYCPETVAEGLFAPEAFEQMPGQMAMDERRCYCPDDCNCHHPWRPNYCGCKQHG